MTIRERIRNYAIQRRAIRELSALDDRTLSDLGLSRSRIQAAVSGR